MGNGSFKAMQLSVQNISSNLIWKLRRNLIESRAISGFSGQKSGTRIIVGILKSF